MEQIALLYTSITQKSTFPINEWELQLAIILNPTAKSQFHKLVAWDWNPATGQHSYGRSSAEGPAGSGGLVFQCDEGNYLVVEVLIHLILKIVVIWM
jgi:hypothetical protein